MNLVDGNPCGLTVLDMTYRKYSFNPGSFIKVIKNTKITPAASPITFRL